MSSDNLESMASDESQRFAPTMPERSLVLEFYIDTNRINARRGLPNMNQLEKWHENHVISIQMPEEALDEAMRGNSPERTRKAQGYIYSTVTRGMQAQYRHILKDIENILFPGGAQTAGSSTFDRGQVHH